MAFTFSSTCRSSDWHPDAGQCSDHGRAQEHRTLNPTSDRRVRGTRRAICRPRVPDTARSWAAYTGHVIAPRQSRAGQTSLDRRPPGSHASQIELRCRGSSPAQITGIRSPHGGPAVAGFPTGQSHRATGLPFRQRSAGSDNGTEPSVQSSLDSGDFSRQLPQADHLHIRALSVALLSGVRNKLDLSAVRSLRAVGKPFVSVGARLHLA